MPAGVRPQESPPLALPEGAPGAAVARRPRAGPPAWVLLAIAGGVILPFVALCAFAHPQNDDYLFAALARRVGWASANVTWYRIWTGRYLATALMSASPVVFGSLAAYRLALAAVLALLAWAPFALATAVAPGEPAPRRWAVALSLAALFLAGMPDVPQGIYWLTGAVTYQLGAALLVFAVALSTSARRLDGRARRLRTALGALLLVCAAGTSEVVGLYGIAFLVAALAVQWVRTRALDRDLADLLLAAALGTAVVVLSPGNGARLHRMDRDAAGALVSSFQAATSYAGRWLTTGPAVPLAALLVPGFAEAARRADRRPLHPALAFALSASTFLASFFPPFYGGGMRAGGETIIAPLEPRTVNVMYGFFLVAFFWTVYCATAWATARRTAPIRMPPWMRVAFVLAAVLAAAGPSSNLRAALGDLLSGSARRYDRAQSERDRLIAACASPVCSVPPIAERPATLFFHENAVDVRSDTPFWREYRDGSFAATHGKASVVLEGSPPAR